MLIRRLTSAIKRLNPTAAPAAQSEALRRVLRLDAPDTVARNRLLHRFLVDGVEVDYVAGEGRIGGERIRLLDYEQPAANDWLAVNQFTDHRGPAENRRPDVILFSKRLAGRA